MTDDIIVISDEEYRKQGKGLLNSSLNWRLNMQKLQNASVGDELKKQLVYCLQMCFASHHEKMTGESVYYADLIEWDPLQQPNLPYGWEIDPDTHEYIYVGDEENG